MKSGSSTEVEEAHRCVNCGKPVEAGYCTYCGEKVLTEHDRSVLHLISETAELFTHFDSKFLRSLRLLVTKPGFLSEEYIIGRRVRYMKPLQMLIILNVIYYIVAYLCSESGYNHFSIMVPGLYDMMHNRIFSLFATRLVTSAIAGKQISFNLYQQQFDVQLEHLAKSLVILLVPIVAVFLQLVNFRSKKYFVEHLIMATHLVSFYLVQSIILLTTITAASWLSGTLAWSHATWQIIFKSIVYLSTGILAAYLFLALKRFYKRPAWEIGIETVLFIAVIITAITNIYDFILFIIALCIV